MMGEELRIEHGAYSDIGLVRTENQDSFGALPDSDDEGEGGGLRLFVVADGMGGHKRGGEASKIAVDAIRSCFLQSAGESVPETMRRAFEVANESIYRQSLNLFPPGIMGSTCTALVISGDSAFIGHVGDSRAYRVTASAIEQMTEDHSVVGELQRRGRIDKNAALSHPERSQITRALGVKPEVKVDISKAIPLEGTERFLLCTDGLSNAVSEQELRETLVTLGPQEASRALVTLAVSRGGEDNVTAQVIHLLKADARDGGIRGFLRNGVR
jgi:PPM family protein phosphatase